MKKFKINKKKVERNIIILLWIILHEYNNIVSFI